MSERKARAARQDRRACGLPAFPEPNHNFVDLEDTRHDRRRKQFRPKAYRIELEASSPRKRMAFVNKWNKIFYSHTDARTKTDPTNLASDPTTC